MKGEQLGFIAQEVEKGLPQVVLTENNTEKTNGIKYTKIIPIMAKAIQELKSENDSLRAEMKAKDAAIEERIKKSRNPPKITSAQRYQLPPPQRLLRAFGQRPGRPAIIALDLILCRQ